MEPSTTIHEDDDVVVRHFSGDYRFRLISFSSALFDPQPGRIYAEGSCRKLGIEAIGFVAKRPHWFPAHRMRAAVEATIRHIATLPARPAVAYGHSMGGYGALRYADPLGCHAVLACGPQMSIDPADVASFDRRFAAYFDAADHREMRISPGDVSAPAYVLFDPRSREDRHHVARLSGGSVRPVLLPGGGHETMDFMSSAILFDLLEAIDGDQPQRRMRHVLRSARRLRPAYYVRMVEMLLRRQRFALASALIRDAKRRGFGGRSLLVSALIIEAVSKDVATGRESLSRALDSPAWKPEDQRRLRAALKEIEKAAIGELASRPRQGDGQIMDQP